MAKNFPKRVACIFSLNLDPDPHSFSGSDSYQNVDPVPDPGKKKLTWLDLDSWHQFFLTIIWKSIFFRFFRAKTPCFWAYSNIIVLSDWLWTQVVLYVPVSSVSLGWRWGPSSGIYDSSLAAPSSSSSASLRLWKKRLQKFVQNCSMRRKINPKFTMMKWWFGSESGV